MVRKNIPVNTVGKDLSTIGGRLAHERTRLRMTVVDFAIQCGVTKQTQIKYEANQNHPDTRYLMAAQEKGCDIWYVLSGQRELAAVSDLHQNLIEAFEAAPEDLRRAAFAVLLSPWRRGLLDQPMNEPGYFQAQIQGEDSARYERFRLQEKLPAPYLDTDKDDDSKKD